MVRPAVAASAASMVGSLLRMCSAPPGSLSRSAPTPSKGRAGVDGGKVAVRMRLWGAFRQIRGGRWQTGAGSLPPMSTDPAPAPAPPTPAEVAEVSDRYRSVAAGLQARIAGLEPTAW